QAVATLQAGAQRIDVAQIAGHELDIEPFEPAVVRPRARKRFDRHAAGDELTYQVRANVAATPGDEGFHPKLVERGLRRLVTLAMRERTFARHSGLSSRAGCGAHDAAALGHRRARESTANRPGRRLAHRRRIVGARDPIEGRRLENAAQHVAHDEAEGEAFATLAGVRRERLLLTLLSADDIGDR